MTDYKKFLPTGLAGKGINLYIAEMVEDLIKDVCEGSVSQEDAIFALCISEHMHLPQYIDIPRGIEGDHFIREIVAAIETFLNRIDYDFKDFFELAKERYDDNKPMNITAANAGIWIGI